jgi:peptidoglycan/xylan/chitin deacetylase (PgdA/CDA1 family)
MSMTPQGIDILTYHSISDGPGPTCITPETFRRQMAIVAECGYRGVALAEIVGWLRGEGRPTGKPIVLTFDDGFTDFAGVAVPEIKARDWNATVFLPAGKAGGVADWEGNPGRPPQRLMSWQAAKELAEQGIEVAARGVTHTDLTALTPQDAQREVAEAKQRIEEQIGRPVTGFAAPYGRTNPAVREEIRRHYQAAVSTELGQAQVSDDPHHLPRIEMWYFRNPKRWRSYLEGARSYFFLRKILRRARALVRS